MAKNTNKPAAETKRFNAYTVREFELNGAVDHDWMRIGVAFPHKDGKGFDAMLQAIPVDGKVVLRLHEPKENTTQE
jgi:hypothetical protein